MPDIVSHIVEICVFSSSDSGPRYLLLRRSETDKLYPGIWQIVTGKIEDGERAVDAAFRELKEETALEPVRFWVVPHSNSFYVADEDAIHHTVFFAAEVEKDSAPRLSSEHQMFRWMLFDEAQSTLVWPGHKKGLEIVHEYIVGRTLAAKLLELQTH